MTARAERWLVQAGFWLAVAILIGLVVRQGAQRFTATSAPPTQLSTAILIIGTFISISILLGTFLYLNVQIDARNLAELALAEEKQVTEQAYRRQTALAEIELAINQPHELQRVLDRLAQIVADLLPATGASVIVWDGAAENFVISASTIPGQAGQTGGATQWIVERKQPLIVSDIREDPFGANSLLTEYGLQSYAGVPLLVEGDALGVLYALDKKPRDYRVAEMDFLTALAARAALAISKVQLYNQLQDMNAQLERRVESRTTELAESNRRLHELSGRLLRLQDEERRRLARELHDVTAQNLSAVTLNLAQLTTTGERNQQLVTESVALAEQCLREIRTLAYVLHPPMLDEYGLVRALEWFLEGFTKRSGVKVQLTAAADIGRLPTEAELALFRIVQEALTNIHRHSGSATASIQLTRTATHATLVIEDQGLGATETGTEQLGVGITGMRERLWQLGGSLDVQSHHKGTTVRAAVPVEIKPV